MFLLTQIIFLVCLYEFLSEGGISWKRPLRNNETPADLQQDMQQQRRRNTRMAQQQSIVKQQQEKNNNNKKLPLLVIGGSDGSGTRSFAHAVKSLGVPLKADLRINLDVSSAPIFDGQGFPPLVNLVLGDVHSVNYQVDDLSDTVRSIALNETRKFVDSIQQWQQQVEHSMRRMMRHDRYRAVNVSVAIKAPATMILLPLLQNVVGPIKYVHVVRDGRDVSLSSNQSPVLKFYNSTYTNAEARRTKYANGLEPVLAMHLWNDWNTQALEWERTHVQDDLDYLVMRSEDLVDPTQKFSSLYKLAKFVGSLLTDKEICCLSQRDAVDLGQSEAWSGKVNNTTRTNRRQLRKNESMQRHGSIQGETLHERRSFRDTNDLLSRYRAPRKDPINDDPRNYRHDPNHEKRQGRDTPANVQERYGKWRRILNDKPELSAMLHDAGANGLATFGYEPHQTFLSNLDGAPVTTTDFSCDDSVVCD